MRRRHLTIYLQNYHNNERRYSLEGVSYGAGRQTKREMMPEEETPSIA